MTLKAKPNGNPNPIIQLTPSRLKLISTDGRKGT